MPTATMQMANLGTQTAAGSFGGAQPSGNVSTGYEYDGSSLTPKAWKIEDEDTKAYIDPQFFENQMWYISPSGTFGDPAKRETQMPVRSSNPGQIRYQGINFADPSPVRFKGELHLFMSKDLHIFWPYEIEKIFLTYI